MGSFDNSNIVVFSAEIWVLFLFRPTGFWVPVMECHCSNRNFLCSRLYVIVFDLLLIQFLFWVKICVCICVCARVHHFLKSRSSLI